jgi:hypothetical protein
MHNRVCATQAAWQATHVPRVEVPIPRVEMPHPKVGEITEAHHTQAVTATQHKDRRKLMSITTPPVPQQSAQTPASQSRSQSCASLPYYISQDEDDNQAPTRQTHRIGSQKYHAGSYAVMWGHIQATLHCIRRPGDPELYQNPKTNRENMHSNTQADGTTQTPHEVAMQNGKLSDGSKWRSLGVPLAHCKPNHKSHMAALIWKRIERLAQGMPGCNTSTNTIVFIKKHQVPHNRVKDVTYGLITCLIRPDK